MAIPFVDHHCSGTYVDNRLLPLRDHQRDKREGETDMEKRKYKKEEKNL
jgi:hypothetical protein